VALADGTYAESTVMTLRADGKVGVGTTSPAYTLDVGGNINIASGYNLKIGGANAVFSNWTVNGSDIYRPSGNVGIGTNNPRWGLEVTPPAGKGGVLSCSDSAIFSHNLYYSGGWKYGAASKGGAYMRMIDSEIQFWNAPNSGSGTWDTAGGTATTTQRMTIDESGNVGIGTASPGAKLDVNGGIRYDTSLVSTSSTQRLWTSGSSVNWIQFHTSGTSTNHILDIQANNGNCVLSSRSSTPLLLNPSNGGNVGIGTASPSYNLDVNGSFGAKNKGWYITGGGGNAVYNGANSNKNYFAYNVNNTVYGSSVTTYNGASSSAWRSNDGVFTYPEAGLYQVTIHMFINATSSGRYGVFRLNDSGGTSQFSQYMYFTPSGYAAQYQRSWTTFVRVESGWQSYMQPESGSITLYLANQHTCLLIDKIC
jgi:hypothetical protein